MIRRDTTPEERRALHARLKEITPFVGPGEKAIKKDALFRMMVGFSGGAAMTKEGVALIVTSYLDVLADVPAWAVVRTCTRFSTHQVTAEELDESKLDYAFRPSAAQVHKVAAAMASPVQTEHARLLNVLDAVVSPEALHEPPEVRERVMRKMDEFLKGRQEAEKLAAERIKERTKERLEQNEADEIARRRREYIDNGLRPPEPSGPWGLFPSLAYLIEKQGYRIEELPGGERVLVAPAMAKPKAVPPEPEREEIPF